MQNETGLVTRRARSDFSQAVENTVDHSEDFQWKWFC